MCRMFYFFLIEQLKIQFFRVRTLIEYCIFRAFTKILKKLRIGIGIDGRLWDDFPDRARMTTMNTMMMTVTTMTITTTTKTISKRRKPKPSQSWVGAGRGGGVQLEGGAGRCPLRPWTRTAARAPPQTTTSTVETTKMARAAAAERAIATWTQEE